MKNKILFLILGILMILQVTSFISAITINDRVEVYNTGTSGLLVLNSACGSKIGGKFNGAQGTIISGPIYCSSYNRWKIQWSDGLVGWSAENWLRKISTCSNQCSSGQTRCNGYNKQSCVNSNGCYVWGGDSYCSNGCAYGQCINSCNPNWNCGSWSSCVNGQQTRTCTDLNNCGTVYNKPAISQSCVIQCTPQSLSATCGTSVCGNKLNNCGQTVSCGNCASGQSCSNGQCINSGNLPTLKWPLSGSKDSRTILSGGNFGNDWTWTLCGGLPKKHTGIDIQATAGEEVYASYDGVVKSVYTASSTNNWAKGIVIESSGFTIAYIHVNPWVSVGNSVMKGQKIATIAAIDNDDHLHFGVRNSPYSSIAERGGLPQINGNSDYDSNGKHTYCKSDPLFSEKFVNPLTLNYESNGCTPQCSGKQCGDNGCGGSCGSCSYGQTCSNGQCSFYPVQQCSPGSKRCNGNSVEMCKSDGSGWSGIQTCSYGCSNNNCNTQTCTPQCSGKQCGSNGCGGICGTCQSGQTCNSNGQCMNSNPTCINQCSYGSSRCNNKNSEYCKDSNGDGCSEWSVQRTCNYGCNSNYGFCNSCNPNLKYCDGNYLYTCSSDGFDLSSVYCSSGCSNGQCMNSCSNQCTSGQTRCNGYFKQSCSDFNVDGCLEWGGDSYCSSGCAYGQCISNSNNCPTCQSMNYQCGSFGYSNGCPTINCGNCLYGQYCQTTNTNSYCTRL